MVAFKPRMTQSCGTLLSDWLTSTDVHVDGFSVSVTVSSGSRTSEEDDIAVVNLFGWFFFFFFFGGFFFLIRFTLNSHSSSYTVPWRNQRLV